MAHDHIYNRALVTARGRDAQTFLNGQFTNDVQRIALGHSVPGAFCSPKGRVLALADMGRTQDGYTLLTDAALAETLLRTLRRYVMRADVVFDLAGDDAVTAVDPTTHRQLINAGVPRVTPATSEQFVPQMLNLDLLGGIDFTKGCYTGQEIVARTHNLGTIKRRMLGYHCRGGTPAPGMTVTSANGEKVGQIVDAMDDRLLAVIRLARSNEDLRVADSDIVLAQRFALPYSIPEMPA